MLSFREAISVLVQAAQKGTSVGAYSLRECALIADAMEHSRQHLDSAEKERELFREKFKMVLDDLDGFQHAVEQINRIHCAPGLPGSCDAEDGVDVGYAIVEGAAREPDALEGAALPKSGIGNPL